MTRHVLITGTGSGVGLATARIFLNYLKARGMNLGFLVNFPYPKAQIKRMVFNKADDWEVPFFHREAMTESWRAETPGVFPASMALRTFAASTFFKNVSKDSSWISRIPSGATKKPAGDKR